MGLLAERRLASIAALTSLGISTHRISDSVCHFGQFSGSNSKGWKFQMCMLSETIFVKEK